MLEHETPHVIIEAPDRFMVCVMGERLPAMTRAEVMVLRTMLNDALNTSAEELGDDVA